MQEREFSTASVLTLVTGKAYGDLDPERSPRAVLREAFELADHVFGCPIRLYQRVGKAGDVVNSRVLAQLPWLAGAVENAPCCGEDPLRAHLARVTEAVGARQTLRAGEPTEGWSTAEDWPAHWGPYPGDDRADIMLSDAPYSE